jgi:hypothetical protein
LVVVRLVPTLSDVVRRVTVIWGIRVLSIEKDGFWKVLALRE